MSWDHGVIRKEGILGQAPIIANLIACKRLTKHGTACGVASLASNTIIIRLDARRFVGFDKSYRRNMNGSVVRKSWKRLAIHCYLAVISPIKGRVVQDIDINQ